MNALVALTCQQPRGSLARQVAREAHELGGSLHLTFFICHTIGRGTIVMYWYCFVLVFVCSTEPLYTWKAPATNWVYNS
jgi:hypothetical protein